MLKCLNCSFCFKFFLYLCALKSQPWGVYWCAPGNIACTDQYLKVGIQMRNSHTLPIQAACHGKMINYQRRVLSYYDNKRLWKVYYYYYNMHFLYLYLLNSQEIWWLKWKVRLLQYVCFAGENVMLHLESACDSSNLTIATSLLWERMYSLMVSLLICWSD